MEWDQIAEIAQDYVPDEFYYQTWGSQFTQPGEASQGHVGGLPMGSEDHEWPCCNAHGPLLHLWSAQDIKTGDTVQHFVCAEICKGEVSVNYGCCGDITKLWSVEFGCFARRVSPSEQIRELTPPPGCPEFPRRDFKWVPIKLLDRKRIEDLPMEFNSFFNLGDGKFVHSDTICRLESEEDEDLEKHHFLLHRSRGLPVQHPEGLDRCGYFVTLWSGGDVPFMPFGNTVHLHMSYDLVMKWAN